MNNFWRVVRLALRYRLTLACAIGCSLGVALLWCANIGTVYPIIEVVFQNKSVPDWADGEVLELENTIGLTRNELQQIQSSLARSDATNQGHLAYELDRLTTKLNAEQEALEWATWLQPHAHRYLPTTPFSTLVIVVLLLLAGTLLKDAFLVGNMVLVERLAQLATFNLRKQFYRKTLRMDLRSFGEDHTAKLMSRFTNDMGALTSGISTLLGKAIREPLKMCVCLVGACIISWRLLFVSMIIAPLAIYLVTQLASSIRRTSRRAMEEMSNLYGVLNESFSGIRLVKAFTMERFERRRFHQRAKTYYLRSMRIVKYNSLIRPTTELAGIGIIGMAMLAGGYLVLNQQTHLFGVRISSRPLQFGALITFYALLIGASDPLRKIAGVFGALQSSAAAADRIYELLDRESEILEIDEPTSIQEGSHEIVFQDVSFHYAANQPVIQDFNLTISPGETIAIVGPNGCGKSTLTSLIPRFYDPVSGVIKIDHIDLRHLRLRELRKTVGIVSQQTMLFDDTIMNNIRYGSLSASDNAVINAAKQAKAHEFITQQLTDGYDTIVGESGGKLSGGQRQRIALARVILRNPDILILDEATSQIDPKSEQLIHQALAEFTRDRTTLLITHRSSSLTLADRIIVMDEGKLLDQGTTSVLLERCSLFRRLFEHELKKSS